MWQFFFPVSVFCSSFKSLLMVAHAPQLLTYKVAETDSRAPHSSERESERRSFLFGLFRGPVRVLCFWSCASFSLTRPHCCFLVSFLPLSVVRRVRSGGVNEWKNDWMNARRGPAALNWKKVENNISCDRLSVTVCFCLDENSRQIRKGKQKVSPVILICVWGTFPELNEKPMYFVPRERKRRFGRGWGGGGGKDRQSCAVLGEWKRSLVAGV